MQSLFRGHLVRVPFRVSRLMSLAAIVRIQSVFRMALGRHRAHDRWCDSVAPCVASFQAAWRGFVDRRRVRQLRARRDRLAATRAQSAVRGWLERIRHLWRVARAAMLASMRRMRAAVLLQRVARGYLGRCRARRRLAFACKIMKWWRWLVRSNLGAVRDIQRVARGFAARRRVKHLRATAMQRAARGMLARRRVAAIREALRAAEKRRFAEECRQSEVAGDEGVQETLEFLLTKPGKQRLKEERKVVKVTRRETNAQRKLMSGKKRRRAEAGDAFHLFDTDASESIEMDEFKAIMEELCLPYVGLLSCDAMCALPVTVCRVFSASHPRV